MHLLATPEVM